MLDKSVPFAKLFMRRGAGTPIPAFPLPPGFKFAMFSDGCEADWARIETSVGEFDSEFAALMLFKEQFIPHIDELYRRCLFIETDGGVKVATSNAWWSYVYEDRRSSLMKRIDPRHMWLRDEADEDRRAWVHWVSVDVRFQGLGLGKAVVARCMEIMRDIEGDVDMFLSTQTWSYKAIDIYKKCGFEPTDEKILYTGKSRNDYKKALKILKELEDKR